jgi:hypothetical protein
MKEEEMGKPCSAHEEMNAGSSLADSSPLKLEAIRSSQTSVHTKTRRCCIPENGILHSHHRGNLSYHTMHIGIWWESQKNGEWGDVDWITIGISGRLL